MLKTLLGELERIPVRRIAIEKLFALAKQWSAFSVPTESAGNNSSSARAFPRAYITNGRTSSWKLGSDGWPGIQPVRGDQQRGQGAATGSPGTEGSCRRAGSEIAPT